MTKMGVRRARRNVSLAPLNLRTAAVKFEEVRVDDSNMLLLKGVNSIKNPPKDTFSIYFTL